MRTTTTDMAKTPIISRSHCNRCAQETKHIILASRRVEGSEEVEDYGPIYWWDQYEFLECCGCEAVCMRHTLYFGPTDETTVTIYPPQVTRRRPHWLTKVPRPMVTLINQVYQALDSDSRALALMGARAVLDMVLTESVGDLGPFSAKLDALEDSGAIGTKNRKFLEAALDAGSAAGHRGYQPSTDDVGAVMDIVENLLQAVYHLDSLADQLKKSTPPRARRKKDS